MAHANCPDCQAVVDGVNRELLEAGGFTTNSALRDDEMRARRLELLADTEVGCELHRCGEGNGF